MSLINNIPVNDYDNRNVSKETLDYIVRCGKALNEAMGNIAEIERIAAYVAKTSPCPELKALVRFYGRGCNLQTWTGPNGDGAGHRWGKCLEKMRVLYRRKAEQHKRQMEAREYTAKAIAKAMMS